MAVCCCSLAGTAACQHCYQNPFATDVWTNKTVTVDHVEAKPFGNGIDVCPVCGKPSTIGKPKTNADRIRSMTDEELAELISDRIDCCECEHMYAGEGKPCHNGETCPDYWLDWLKQEVGANDS